MKESGRAGVFPAEAISRFVEEGAIALAAPARPAQLQPASIDLTLGRKAWRVRASFLPSPARTVTERLEDGLLMHALDLDNDVVFERGCVYVVELGERLRLPPDVSGAANPKSSTGRIDVFVRLVADRAGAFDEIPPGYRGPLYAEISPRTFSIVARAGSSLNQLRLKRGACRLSDAELEKLHAETPLIDGGADIDGGLGLRVRLAGGKDEIVGWRARRHAALIDVDEVGACAAEDYFEPIVAPRSGFVILDPDEFYILASREALVIPPDYAAEMTPINPGLGEFRVHYAGFFDPGFGWSEKASAGSRAVLEVRSHDAPFVLEDGQLVARLAYERMAARPGRLYGAELSSNYQGQGLKLSKHFR
ncbi:MAG: 2'-deoxycytidine 5'-triphosphate deaminase [Alphaproteobacteria bacterium]|nr:2'-deoxycytidine 5'-triphosphate deaminase [Alphaproteobacteria bacterium]